MAPDSLAAKLRLPELLGIGGMIGGVIFSVLGMAVGIQLETKRTIKVANGTTITMPGMLRLAGCDE